MDVSALSKAEEMDTGRARRTNVSAVLKEHVFELDVAAFKVAPVIERIVKPDDEFNVIFLEVAEDVGVPVRALAAHRIPLIGGELASVKCADVGIVRWRGKGDEVLRDPVEVTVLDLLVVAILLGIEG